MIKLIVTDLDNTLLDEKGAVTQETIQLLQLAYRHGVHFAVATGRSLKSAEGIAKQVGIPYTAICYNGSLILDPETGLTIASEHLSKPIVLELIRFCRKEDLYIQMYQQDEIIVERLQTDRHPDPDLAFAGYREVGDFLAYPYFPTPKMLIAAGKDRVPTMQKKLEEQFAGRAYFAQSDSHLIEVMPFGVDKGSALLKLADYLKIDPVETIGFGDNTNDIPLLLKAGIGVAVGNSAKPLKEIADYVCIAHRNKGFDEGLQKFIFSKPPFCQ